MLVGAMDLDEITYTAEGGVAEITLDRPEVRNAISARPGGTRDQILHALQAAAADPEVGAVLLKGNGVAFSSGGDITGNARRETPAEELAFVERAEAFHAAVRRCPLPIVAAVHGSCLGAGLALASCCDIVIAADDSSFGLPEGRIGLIGAVPLVPVVGRQWAKFLILTGEPIDAHRAVAIGLVLAVVPAAELVDRTRELAARLARMPAASAQLNKRAIDAVADAIEGAGVAAGRAHDAVTLNNAASATAPDGRTFREILEREGMAGLKLARQAQWAEPWLPPI
jgi:enoyl-CoA hydratase/carnithine racemase